MGENKRERVNKRSLFEYVKGRVENIEKEMKKKKMKKQRLSILYFFNYFF